MERRTVRALDGGRPEQAGVLYIDGHVRVDNGSQTQLPRHYVARQRLCLRATTDYWVRHEVARIFIREICAKTDQLIGCSATRTLPGRALGATLGCEASGTL